MPDGQPDLFSLSELKTPWALRVVATLRVADLIAEGVTGLDELAAKTDVNAGALGRVLRHLTARGVFSEPEPGTFALTEPTGLLRDEHPAGLRRWLDINGAGVRMDHAFSHMLEAVRTGEATYARAHGRSIWEDHAVHADMGASFDQLMVGKSSPFLPDVLAGHDWASAGHVVDVGGGVGLLLTHVLRAHDGVRGTVFDQAPTVARAREAIAAAGLADRCEAVAGSFFDRMPSGGDLYVLWNILHDWADTEALAILQRCAEAAAPAGRMLVIEFGDQNPLMFTTIDLQMLCAVGGRERTAQELAAMGAAVGMTLASVTRTPMGLLLVELAFAR